MDAKLDSIVDQFRARLDEMVPAGCREKSLALTNIEQAQMWAEAARNAAGDNPLELILYADPVAVGWIGCIKGKGGAEAWIDLGGHLIPNSRVDPASLPDDAAAALAPAPAAT